MHNIWDGVRLVYRSHCFVVVSGARESSIEGRRVVSFMRAYIPKCG